jgi:hypothetical protein
MQAPLSLTVPMMPAAQAAQAPVVEWIIPYAASTVEAAAAQWQQNTLPNLERLMARMDPQHALEGDERDFISPHERALARAWNLPSGPGAQPGWAAYTAARQPTLAAHADAVHWAFITPCHWRIGADQVHQGDPLQLPLSEEESRSLMDLLAPWFAEDGITLHYEQPLRWLAQGAIFANLTTASLDRVIGRDVRPWLPDGQHAPTLHRLQSEVQMLLYTHAFNDARAARGESPVNAFWVHGTGPYANPSAQNSGMTSTAVCINDLRGPALANDWTSWARHWQAIDEDLIAPLEERLDQGLPTTLTLCGEHNAIQWAVGQRTWLQKAMNLFTTNRLPDLPSLL